MQKKITTKKPTAAKTVKKDSVLVAKVYNQSGKESGSVTLPEAVFGLPWNADLVHQVVQSMLSNARRNTAHAKGRGEVRGGGRKPWKQKGTGRARHGSIRSPIWVGGGVTGGPNKDKNYSRKINKKVSAKALYTVLSKKYKEGEVIFIDSLSTKESKTKEAKKIFDNLAKVKGFEPLASKKRNRAVLTLLNRDTSVERSFKNFSNISVEEVRNMNPVRLLQYKYLVITDPEKSLKVVAARL